MTTVFPTQQQTSTRRVARLSYVVASPQTENFRPWPNSLERTRCYRKTDAKGQEGGSLGVAGPVSQRRTSRLGRRCADFPWRSRHTKSCTRAACRKPKCSVRKSHCRKLYDIARSCEFSQKRKTFATICMEAERIRRECDTREPKKEFQHVAVGRQVFKVSHCFIQFCT